jgi:Protein of unknown function (DUF935)
VAKKAVKKVAKKSTRGLGRVTGRTRTSGPAARTAKKPAQRQARRSNPALAVVELATRKSKERQSKPPLREIGVTGTNFNGGFLDFEDLNPDWRILGTRVEIIDEMRKTDAQVQAILLACKMPILMCKWHVEDPDPGMGKKPTEEQKMMAEFVRKNLFGMKAPWVQMLYDMLSYLDFGFWVGEKVFMIKDYQGEKRIWLKKIAPRHQSTIEKWNVADDGGIISITQNATDTDGRYTERTMSAERVVVLTLNKEAGNWEGQSLLRAVYKHWYIKDKLYRIDAIAHERHGVGIPKIKVPTGATKADYATVKKILENLRAHEKGYVLEVEGFDTSFMEFKTNVLRPLESIKHHDEKMAAAVLANFMNLGFSASGSRATAQTTSTLFLASLQSYNEYICGIFDRHVIQPLVEYNWGVQDAYPTLRATPTGGMDIEKFGRTMQAMSQSKMLWTDHRVVNHIHRYLGLPQPDFEDDEFMKLQEESDPNKKGAPGDNEDSSTDDEDPSRPSGAGPDSGKDGGSEDE